MNILLCTICRNIEGSFDKYINNLKKAVSNVSYPLRYNFYENNSNDNTKNIINNFDFSFFDSPTIFLEDLDNVCSSNGTSSSRVSRLAQARNKCMRLNDNHLWADYIIFIECDIDYNEDFIKNLIERGIENKIDIFSGVAYTCNSETPYDTWAVRNTKYSPPFSTFISDDKKIRKFWSTFSCICMYNAIPFKNGLKFDHINPRTKQSDCDTTVICEIFHANGFNRVYVDERLTCRHFVEGLITFSIEPSEYSDYIYSIIRTAVKTEDDVLITTDRTIRTREWLCRIENVFTPPNIIKDVSFKRSPQELFNHKTKTIHLSEALGALSLE
tara:strand:- start:2181 stop:3164 length:984 start_codon:yes stop_codon:yes gene_type:complete